LFTKNTHPDNILYDLMWILCLLPT